MEIQIAICKNCGNNFSGKYCNSCGQKNYTDADKNILHLFNEGFHFITHFEGTFFNTLKAIFMQPGKLSYDYCRGVRKKYFKPLSFFLFLVVLYLLFPIFQGLNQQLFYHTHGSFYNNFALKKIHEIMLQRSISETQISDLFHEKSEKVSKFLLFIIIPFMAVFSTRIARKKNTRFFDHFIFSTEQISFLILWGFLILPFLIWIIIKLGFFNNVSEGFIGLCILAVFTVRLFLAAKKFYGFKTGHNILFSIAYTFLTAFTILYIYKFILFIITIKMI